MAAFKPQSVPDPLPQPAGRKGIKTGNPVTSPLSYDLQETVLPPQGSGRFKQFYSNNKWYVWAIVLGVIIIAALAFFAFRKQSPEPTKNANVQVNIDAPETAPSGGEVIYKIQIDNHDASKLENMKLELVYDDGMRYVSSTPPADNISGTLFPVPDLGSGENVVLIIKTNVSGSLNDEKRLTARLRYKFSNFNSEFTEEQTHTVRLVTADIVLDVTGPEKATNVKTANYNIFYRNDSDKDINSARIQVTYPAEFKFASSDPSPSLNQNVWNLNTLKQNDSGKISFSGNFTGTKTGQSVLFKVEFLALDDKGSFFTQSSTTYMTAIEPQALSVEQRLVNDAPNNVVKPGDTLLYELTFQNNTQTVATGLNVFVKLDSKAMDPATIKADNGLIEGTTITWNGSGISQLENLKPGESGKIQFSVQLRNPAVKDGSENLTVVTKPQIKSNENPAFLPGNDLTLKVSSPSSIEPALISSDGPVPPKVGETTTLQVILALRNASNDYREGVLVGYVPLGVTFDKTSVSASESAAVKFDPATGKLTWTVGQLTAHSGSANPLRTLKFNVKVTPSGNQVGQPITLFKTISFIAKDTFTDQSISINTQEITTDKLPGEGNGRVVQ
ncbi:MAG TPA: hypothetical protein VHQ41_03710 [Patescibacteria group bacterium]|jgi:hypothetical protein|nr:hypothetical protein [Patescibacteria group bacterium]